MEPRSEPHSRMIRTAFPQLRRRSAVTTPAQSASAASIPPGTPPVILATPNDDGQHGPFCIFCSRALLLLYIYLIYVTYPYMYELTFTRSVPLHSLYFLSRETIPRAVCAGLPAWPHIPLRPRWVGIHMPSR